jgi:hypothetical protein
MKEAEHGNTNVEVGKESRRGRIEIGRIVNVVFGERHSEG